MFTSELTFWICFQALLGSNVDILVSINYNLYIYLSVKNENISMDKFEPASTSLIDFCRIRWQNKILQKMGKWVSIGDVYKTYELTGTKGSQVTISIFHQEYHFSHIHYRLCFFNENENQFVRKLMQESFWWISAFH